MINTLLKAFELANLEVMVVKLPEVSVSEVSSALLVRWNCLRTDLIGKPLLKSGNGILTARHLPPDPRQPDVRTIEVIFTPPLGSAIKSVFRAQSVAGDDQCMLMIGQQQTHNQLEATIANERRLNLALRSGGYALWDHDYETGETYNAPEMIEIFGGKVGDRALDYRSFNSLIHPEDLDKSIDEKIAHAPFGTDVFHTRYRVKTRSGKYAWIECLAAVVRDPASGRPKKCVGLCRNIDNEMLTLDRLKNSELMLKRSQSVSHIGSFKLRLESGVSRLTAELAAMIGLADAMIHPNLDTFIKMIEPGDRQKFMDGLELTKIGNIVKNLEIAVKTPDGRIEWFNVSMEPETNDNGEIENIFGACQQVTERKMLEDKFHQAQKMEAVGQLTGGIAHDFNNLLMVVMGNLQLVENLVKSDEKATKRIRAALEAADKGSDLTRRMLAFSRQQTLQNREVRVNELVNAMQDMLKQALTASIELEVIPASHLWPIQADSTMLETTLLNLTINARDAMASKGGRLIIEMRNRTLDEAYAEKHTDMVAGDYVEISVTDTGTGIEPENLEKVFQPFFTTKPPEAGSGLGLSMIYGFVKQSGGHVQIYSEVGVGTSVKLYLPRLKTVAETATRAASKVSRFGDMEHDPLSANRGRSDRKMKILVVEDNNSVREVAAAMIEDMGFEPVTATSGADGLSKVETMPDIDLMLSDVIMAGGMTGPELAQHAMKVRPDLKILFMSGYAPGSVRQMQDLPDQVELVNKPFTRNDLTAKVMRALAIEKAA
ncbi:hybrid sensor histidine kinase/response regulator [Aestuariivirga litoralis]|uniref:hybrid sensor histidine kinase/response regulator n=1 Tax=Aestuariivirga litoralis TaxID=2650924 RepID=UPI0018C82546|nr:ATP-binding protein [Aestuariivirga litoralis]MBG1231279.1 PAS domain-containing protein [Aestuariivirga litoralis]